MPRIDLSAVFGLAHLDLQPRYHDRHHHHPHFADGEMEALSREAVCLRSHN